MPRTASASDPFLAIASPTRRQILDLLRAGERRVGELCEEMAVSQPAVSQQLAILEQAQLVERRREGKFVVYSLRAEPLADVADWVAHYETFWREKMAALGHHLDAKARKEKQRS